MTITSMWAKRGTTAAAIDGADPDVAAVGAGDWLGPGDDVPAGDGSGATIGRVLDEGAAVADGRDGDGRVAAAGLPKGDGAGAVGLASLPVHPAEATVSAVARQPTTNARRVVDDVRGPSGIAVTLPRPKSDRVARRGGILSRE
jgi:hypothetical protein